MIFNGQDRESLPVRRFPILVVKPHHDYVEADVFAQPCKKLSFAL
jgi:hypothetical protein